MNQLKTSDSPQGFDPHIHVDYDPLGKSAGKWIDHVRATTGNRRTLLELPDGPVIVEVEVLRPLPTRRQPDPKATVKWSILGAPDYQSNTGIFSLIWDVSMATYDVVPLGEQLLPILPVVIDNIDPQKLQLTLEGIIPVLCGAIVWMAEQERILKGAEDSNREFKEVPLVTPKRPDLKSGSESLAGFARFDKRQIYEAILNLRKGFIQKHPRFEKAERQLRVDAWRDENDQ